MEENARACKAPPGSLVPYPRCISRLTAPQPTMSGRAQRHRRGREMASPVQGYRTSPPQARLPSFLFSRQDSGWAPRQANIMTGILLPALVKPTECQRGYPEKRLGGGAPSQDSTRAPEISTLTSGAGFPRNSWLESRGTICPCLFSLPPVPTKITTSSGGAKSRPVAHS